MAYWIVVGSDENMRIAEARGFDLFGFKSTRRREVSRMRPGDRLVFYLTGIMKFGGIVEVTSEYFQDTTPVFKSKKPVSGRAGGPTETYPFRVKVRPIAILRTDQYLDVKEIAPALQYTKKWPAEHWRLAFQGNLHEIPESDYRLIEFLVRKAAAT